MRKLKTRVSGDPIDGLSPPLGLCLLFGFSAVLGLFLFYATVVLPWADLVAARFWVVCGNRSIAGVLRLARTGHTLERARTP